MNRWNAVVAGLLRVVAHRLANPLSEGAVRGRLSVLQRRLVGSAVYAQGLDEQGTGFRASGLICAITAAMLCCVARRLFSEPL